MLQKIERATSFKLLVKPNIYYAIIGSNVTLESLSQKKTSKLGGNFKPENKV